MSQHEPTSDDERLVEACRDGDRDAFGALVTKYQSLVYGVCYQKTGNPVDAEDLSQEAFLKAYTRLHALRDASKFGNWLYRITINVCRMWGRRQQRESALVQSLTESTPEAVETDSPSPYKSEGVLRTVNTLSHENRLAVRLHYINGMSCVQIGEFLGISSDAVKSRLYQARKQLRKEIETMLQESFEKQRPGEDFKDKILKVVDDWVGKYAQEENVLGVAAVEEVAEDHFWEGTTIHLLYLKKDSEKPGVIGGPDRGTFVTPLDLSVADIESMMRSPEEICTRTWAFDIPFADLLYDAHIYFDPEQRLARAKEYVRQHRFSEKVTQRLAQRKRATAEELLEKYRQAAALEDWAASLWCLQCASFWFTLGILDKHKKITRAGVVFRRFPEFLRDVSAKMGVPQLYPWFMQVHRLGKGKERAEQTLGQMEAILKKQYLQYIVPFKDMVETHSPKQVPRERLNQALALGIVWSGTFFLFRLVFQPCVLAGYHDGAIWGLRHWDTSLEAIIELPGYFETLMGKEVSSNRPDFVKALRELECVDDDLYRLILQFYDWEDASEALVTETFKIVEQIAALL